MIIKQRIRCALFAALAIAVLAPVSRGDVVVPINASGWVVHNGTAAVGGTTDSPTFTPGDLITVMAPFSGVSLASDGDYLTVSTNLTLTARTTTGVNTLNTQLRFGVFNGPAGAVVAGDTSNLGFIAQYANLAQTHLKVFAPTTVNADPMLNSILGTAIGSTALSNVTADPENDSIQGANPTAFFTMTLKRMNGKLDISGQISGGDYLSTFNVQQFTSTVFPEGGTFTFNRLGFLLGDGVNAGVGMTPGGATYSNVSILTNVAIVPESRFVALSAATAAGAALACNRLRRRIRAKG